MQASLFSRCMCMFIHVWHCPSYSCSPIPPGPCAALIGHEGVTHYVTGRGLRADATFVSDTIHTHFGEEVDLCSKALVLSSCLYAYPPCHPDTNEQVVFCVEECLANSVAVCNQSSLLDFMTNGTENFLTYVLQFDCFNTSSYLLPEFPVNDTECYRLSLGMDPYGH